MITVLYFARLKETLDCDRESIPFSSSTASPAALRALLQARGEPWLSALANEQILVAINQTMAEAETAIASGDEVAFFPPVTGG